MRALRSLGRIRTIAGRDVRAIGASPFGLGLLAGTAALAGALLVVDLRPGQARLDVWFEGLFVLVGVLAALVPTRVFAEEERRGALELLLTAPVTPVEVAVGKSLGATAIVMSAIGATGACPLVVAHLGHPDPGPIVTGYIGLTLAVAAFTAIGCTMSAATSNPLISASATAGLLLASWAVGAAANGLRGRPQAILAGVSPASHITGFLRGTLGPRDLGYFAIVALGGLVATVAVLQSRR